MLRSVASGLSGRVRKYVRDMRTLPGDARLAWRLEGPPGVWREIAARSFYRVFRSGRFLVVEQELADVARRPPPPGVSIRRLDELELPVLATIVTARTLERFGDHLADGGICLVAWRGNRPVGYTWISRRMVGEADALQLPLPADACYGWGLYVIPGERRGGVGTALVSARLAAGREEGFRTSWRAIRVDNRPSIRTLEKTAARGTSVLGEMSYVKVLARFHTRYRQREADAPRGGE
ncbi:MAG: GNAT family N-acetyltransferase [Gemmatimonadetes bacterium]|nr:GNAT family N-acetyltransferase [Gemmatimonadota bacterium]